MALLDLADVTRTLIWMLETRIPALDGWPGSVNVTVSPLPPDRLVDAGTDLGLYLYHLSEDPHWKNPPPEGGAPSSRPMALNLYYQLTAQVGELEGDAFRAQLLMGAAVRVMHDFPLITDSTTLTDVNGVAHGVLAHRGLQGRNNRIRITMRPVPVDEAVDYWTAGDAPLRLAAYYQVSVIFLDAEPPPTVASRVLSYGSGVFATGAPTLTGSRATLAIVVGRDAAATQVPVQPAQISLGDRFQLDGTALTGASTTLRLRDERGAKTVDPGAWAVVASADRVLATVGLALEDASMLPGVWSASVVVTKTVKMGSASRTVTHTSNETPIVVAPRLDPVSPTGPTLGSAAPGDLRTWTGWRFQDPDIPTDEGDPRAVRLYIGETLMARHTDATPLDPGEYTIVDASTLQVRLPTDLAPGSTVPVRVGVRGAWSTPMWLEVT